MLKTILKLSKVVMLSGIILCCFSGCKKQLPVAEEISYQEVVKDTSKDDLLDTIGARPNKVESEDNLDSYIYEKSEYLSYVGTMKYYLVEDKVIFSRWETTADSEENGQNIYKDICDNMKEQFGEGQETVDSGTMTSVWNTSDGKTKTVIYSKTESDIKVSIMETES